MPEYNLCEGKYTIVYGEKAREYVTEIRRNGKEWKTIADVAGDNVLNALLFRVLELAGTK